MTKIVERQFIPMDSREGNGYRVTLELYEGPILFANNSSTFVITLYQNGKATDGWTRDIEWFARRKFRKVVQKYIGTNPAG